MIHSDSRNKTTSWVAGALLLSCSAAAQRPDSSVTERVQVRVRTAIVVLTDAKGQPLANAPTPADLDGTESGSPVEIVGIESLAAPRTAQPAAPDSAARPPEARPARATPQYLYVDADSLHPRSVIRVAGAFSDRLGLILERGPLTVVVAGSEPKTLLESGTDWATAAAALRELRKVPGNNRLIENRRELAQAPDRGTARRSSPELLDRERRMRAKMAIQQELRLIQASLERLTRWAASVPAARPALLYFASDGFDVDLTEFWANWLSSNQNDDESAQIRAQFQGAVQPLLQRMVAELSDAGFVVVPVAVGAASASFGRDAATVGKRGSSDLWRPLDSAPVTLSARPLEPLHRVAAATGGAVVVDEKKLGDSHALVGRVFAVEYRTRAVGPPRLQLRSRSEAIIVRSVRPAEVEPELTEPKRNDFAVRVGITPLEKLPNGRSSGMLQVTADFEPILLLLERVGPARVRITITVEAEGVKPFVQFEEMDIERRGEGSVWTYEAPLQWPPIARRVVATVEELRTGTRGTGGVELPAD